MNTLIVLNSVGFKLILAIILLEEIKINKIKSP